MSEQPFDTAQIERLRGLRQGTLLPQLLQAYRQQVVDLIQTMESAVAAADLPAVRSAAHTLKSASLSMGATAMGELCARIEAKARVRLDLELTKSMAELRSCHIAMLPAIEALLSG
jgi:HPt (histidine-containing phosphotransfer) domain-containing protein